MSSNLENLTERREPVYPLALLALTAVIFAAVSVVAALFPMLSTDTLCRYAPMAEAFAAGDWSEAFHPRFGVGMPVVAGALVKLTGLNGFSSCAAVASAAWALGALPIFGIADRVFDRRTAWFAAILYLISPLILLWGLKGLREPFKSLGVLLAADSLLRVRSTGRRVLVEGLLGLTLLFTFKVDTVLVGLLFLAAFAVCDRFRVRTWTLTGFAVLMLQPMCWLTYDWTGWWVPVPHIQVLCRRLFGG